jgi:hypothetical protein
MFSLFKKIVLNLLGLKDPKEQIDEEHYLDEREVELAHVYKCDMCYSESPYEWIGSTGGKNYCFKCTLEYIWKQLKGEMITNQMAKELLLKSFLHYGEIKN